MRKRKFTAIENKAHDDDLYWPSLEEIKDWAEEGDDLSGVFFLAAAFGVCVMGICFAVVYYLF